MTLFDANLLWRSLMLVILSGAKDLLFARAGISLKTNQITRVKPAFAEILPGRIGSTNQSNFFLAQPTFEVLLPRNGGANVLESLEVYKTVNTVLAGESRRGRRPRLPSGAKLRRILTERNAAEGARATQTQAASEAIGHVSPPPTNSCTSPRSPQSLSAESPASV